MAGDEERERVTATERDVAGGRNDDDDDHAQHPGSDAKDEQHRHQDDDDDDSFSTTASKKRQTQRAPRRKCPAWLAAVGNFLRNPDLDLLFLRQCSSEQRAVQFNDRACNRKQKFFDNYVSTTKYHLGTFLPVFLVRQFLRPANFYFLIVGILYCIPSITPVFTAGRYATLGSLAFVITVTAIKEIAEDVKRYREDQRVNSTVVEVLNREDEEATLAAARSSLRGRLRSAFGGRRRARPPRCASDDNRRAGRRADGDVERGERAEAREDGVSAPLADSAPASTLVPWKKVIVGDIVLIKADEGVPADIVLLGSSADDDMCYIETRAIDGETNLKAKMSVALDSSIFATENCRTLIGEVECEAPNANLYEFAGRLRVNLPDETGMPTTEIAKCSLTRDNLLPRGVVLRNTEWVVGLVVFAGKETKLMMNLNREAFKMGHMERTITRFVVLLILIQLVLSFVLAVLHAVWTSRNLSGTDAWYLEDTFSWGAVVQRFFTFFLTLSILVPIALYVTMEIVRALQSVFVILDDYMYCEETGTRARCRNSTLNDELGQITHVFSDKTGTMTRNVMEFRLAFIKDAVVERRRKGDAHDLEFFRLLAVCHTVVPARNEELDRVEYHAPNPDERALVHAAAENDVVLTSRSTRALSVMEDGQPVEYRVLYVLEFTSERKRMSVIVERPDGGVRLYIKGADSVLFERLRQPNGAGGGSEGGGAAEIAAEHEQRQQQQKSAAATPNANDSDDERAREIAEARQAVHKFALDGLRTLVLGYRDLDRDEFDEWTRRYNEAFASLDDRAEKMAALAAELETDVELLGVTAVEDQLQREVPDTLRSFYFAGIKVWMLTGDKQETAINIGLSSGLLSNDMDIMVMRSGDEHDVSAQLDCTEARWRSLEIDGVRAFDKALVVGGDVLDVALHGGLRAKLVAVSELARCVIACRMTPKQKAELVRSMKESNKQATTLAVGDGANDVGMIQVAHLGIGIAGREGMEASLSSDFSIGEFRFLKRLVLVHGRWFYKRNSKLIVYMIYKNVALGAFSVWYATVSAFSGAQFFDPWVHSMYNLFLTSIPIIVLATLDQELSSAYALFYPEIYRSGQRNSSGKLRVFAYWFFNAMWQSVVMFYIPYYARVDGPVGDGQMMGKDIFQLVSFTILVLVVHAQLAIYQARWTWFSALLYLFSATMWLWMGPAFCSATFTVDLGMAPTLYWTAMRMFSEPLLWLIIVVCLVICIVPPLVVHHWNRMYFPSPKVIVQELEWIGIIHNKRTPRPRASEPTEPRFVQMQPSERGEGGELEAVAFRYGGDAFSQEDNATRYLSHRPTALRRARVLRQNASEAQAGMETLMHRRFFSSDGTGDGVDAAGAGSHGRGTAAAPAAKAASTGTAARSRRRAASTIDPPVPEMYDTASAGWAPVALDAPRRWPRERRAESEPGTAPSSEEADELVYMEGSAVTAGAQRQARQRGGALPGIAEQDEAAEGKEAEEEGEEEEERDEGGDGYRGGRDDRRQAQ